VPFALRLVGRGGRQAWLGVASMGGLFAGILATGSRGGLIAGVAATLVWAFVAGSPRMRRGAIAAVLCIAALIPLFTAQLTNSSSRDVSGRLNENRIALAMWADHPVSGAGPGRYPYLFRDYARKYGDDPRTDRTPHSLPLEIAAEQGIIGLVAWAAASVFLVRYIRRRRVWDSLIGRATILALATYMFGSLALHGGILRQPFLLVGLILAAGAHRVTSERVEELP
jgi:O-antigen ligase